LRHAVYVTYTAWRNTPLEEAAKDFLLARAGLPLGARLWTFGTPRHADGDGWVPERGAATLGAGHLTLAPDQGEVAILSPGNLALDRRKLREIVLGFGDEARVRSVEVQAAWGDAPAWHAIARADVTALRKEGAGRVLRVARSAGPPIDRLRIVLRSDATRSFDVDRIALLP